MLDMIDHQEKATEFTPTFPASSSLLGIWGFCQCIGRALQKAPVGFGSCICTPTRTSHVKSSLTFEHRSRRHLHSDGVLFTYHPPLPCFGFRIVLYPRLRWSIYHSAANGFSGYRVSTGLALCYSTMSGMVKTRRIVMGLAHWDSASYEPRMEMSICYTVNE